MRPEAKLGDYKGLDVPRREPDVSARRSTPSRRALRERTARLDTVDDAASRGDFIVADYLGRDVDGEPFEGGEGPRPAHRARRRAPGRGLRGPALRAPGRARSARSPSPSPTTTAPRTSPAGPPTSRSRSRRSSARTSPSSTTLRRGDRRLRDARQELRDDIRDRLAEGLERQIEAEFREAAVDAASPRDDRRPRRARRGPRARACGTR